MFLIQPSSIISNICVKVVTSNWNILTQGYFCLFIILFFVILIYLLFFFFFQRCSVGLSRRHYLILRVEGMFNVISYINVSSTVTFNMACDDFGHLYNLLITAVLTSLAKLFFVWNSQVPEQVTLQCWSVLEQGTNAASMPYCSDKYKQPGQNNSSGQQTINNVSQLVKRTTEESTDHLQNGCKTTTVGSYI